MKPTSSPKDSPASQTEVGLKQVWLDVPLTRPVPSKKNRYNPRPDGKGVILEKEIRRRSKDLEDAILYALYSACRTIGSETDLVWRKQLQTLLSGLSDDSWREIPSHQWDVYLTRGKSSLTIEITELQS